ncbi:hypothetical protein QMK19_23965 [Streptomyces sp. H10-C2]|nr:MULTISPECIES: hypothetical protein [unclassified Streptomyces]MDJ0342862.1 hypothetical protein [Streptomyces sp. PH10-H1]MDJ0372635.1 hypothetical protein [Streptomyces sp. H10-C2]NEA60794.1 hypothetical protein [Streptomyces sp. SID13666]NEA77255.1 hypothetical protein [Streptomyces sp. SID13588]
MGVLRVVWLRVSVALVRFDEAGMLDCSRPLGLLATLIGKDPHHTRIPAS